MVIFSISGQTRPADRHTAHNNMHLCFVFFFPPQTLLSPSHVDWLPPRDSRRCACEASRSRASTFPPEAFYVKTGQRAAVLLTLACCDDTRVNGIYRSRAIKSIMLNILSASARQRSAWSSRSCLAEEELGRGTQTRRHTHTLHTLAARRCLEQTRSRVTVSGCVRSIACTAATVTLIF